MLRSSVCFCFRLGSAVRTRYAQLQLTGHYQTIIDIAQNDRTSVTHRIGVLVKVFPSSNKCQRDSEVYTACGRRGLPSDCAVICPTLMLRVPIGFVRDNRRRCAYEECLAPIASPTVYIHKYVQVTSTLWVRTCEPSCDHGSDQHDV